MKLSANEAQCRICGEWEDEHHPFTPYEVPKGCVCNPRDWGNPNRIPPTCTAYVRDEVEGDGLCATCEHEQACHATSGASGAEKEKG